MTSALAALALSAATAAAGHRASADLRVCARVVAPLRAGATAVRAPSASRPGAPSVVHVTPQVASRGGTAGVFVAAPGDAQRACGAGCDVRLAGQGGASGTVILTVLPDGAPPGLIER